MEDAIKEVYQDLKSRRVNPSGSFDSAGRWHSDNGDLISVRPPSRSYPYSEMLACRTLKYVRAVAAQFECSSIEELRNCI